MIFKGPPNTKFNVHKPQYGEPGAIRFRADGLFETHNRHLARRMARKFEIVPEEPQEQKPVEPVLAVTPASIPCKKCGETFENKGLLMAHYRQIHPKES